MRPRNGPSRPPPLRRAGGFAPWPALVGAVSGLVAVFSALGWLVSGDSGGDAPDGPAAVQTAVAGLGGRPAFWPTGHLDDAATGTPSAAPALNPVPAGGPARQAAPGQLVEVCGHGQVQLPADDPNPLQRIPAAQRQAALEQVEAQLLAHAQPAVRAATLLVGARSRVAGGRVRIHQLARLAVASQDPAVYAMALRGCQAYAGAQESPCALLSLAQWARLAPDNLHPWLALAAEAAARGDAPAEAEAMQQATRARLSDAQVGLLPAVLAPALRPPVPALQRALVLGVARSLQDGWTLTQANHADLFCSAEALADSSRVPVCEAVARTLVERGRSVADLGSGLAIGRQLGWSASRLAPGLQAQQHFAQLAEAAVALAANGLDFSCALQLKGE